MTRPATILTCAALLALSLAPMARAAQATANETLSVDAATFSPIDRLVLDPTQNALLTSSPPACAQEDLRATNFNYGPDLQGCKDYCAANGWTYYDYWYVGRGLYGCFCCAG